jgi:hypothetical protein
MTKPFSKIFRFEVVLSAKFEESEPVLLVEAVLEPGEPVSCHSPGYNPSISILKAWFKDSKQEVSSAQLGQWEEFLTQEAWVFLN